MNFIESISNYVLENISTKDLPKICEIAITEKLESESIYILAGMNEKDNSFEILNYFDKALSEINIKLPNKEEAAKILTAYYLKEIIQNPYFAFDIMTKIDIYVYKNINWYTKEKKFVGEELKLEHLYTWYREIQDWEDNSTVGYYKDLSRIEQRKKYEEHLIEEAKKALKNYYS